MLDILSCKHCGKAFPWIMMKPDHVCSACYVFGPQPKEPSRNLNLKRKEPENERRAEILGR